MGFADFNDKKEKRKKNDTYLPITRGFPNLTFSTTDPFSCFMYNDGEINAHDLFSILSIYNPHIWVWGRNEIHLGQYIINRRHNELQNKHILTNYFSISENTLRGRLFINDIQNRKIR